MSIHDLFSIYYRGTSVVLRERLGTPPGSLDDGEGSGESLRHQEGKTEGEEGDNGHLHLQLGSDQTDWTAEINVNVFKC